MSWPPHTQPHTCACAPLRMRPYECALPAAGHGTHGHGMHIRRQQQAVLASGLVACSLTQVACTTIGLLPGPHAWKHRMMQPGQLNVCCIHGGCCLAVLCRMLAQARAGTECYSILTAPKTLRARCVQSPDACDVAQPHGSSDGCEPSILTACASSMLCSRQPAAPSMQCSLYDVHS